MKRSRFSEEQVTYALRQHEAGTPVADMCLHRGVVPKAVGPMERLSMDFVHDELFDGRRLRILTVVDQWNREAVVVEPASGYSGQAVAEVLDLYLGPGQAPASITVDHGTEFTSKALEAWAWQRGNQFLSLDHARETIKAWQEDYNHHRPHGSLGNLTPMEYRVRHGHNRTSEAAKFQL
jgi:putative transposase